MPNRWFILTGEYPPQPGGVSDHTARVAAALAEAGDGVRVWAPPLDGGEPPAPAGPAGVRVTRLCGRFGPAALSQLDRAMAGPGPGGRAPRLLVQYVPHAFGGRAMNLPFCLWLARRGRRGPVWVLFHEVAFPLGRGQPLRHDALGVMTRVMAWVVARSAARTFVTIPAWADLLGRIAPGAAAATWLPVGSNVPTAPTRDGPARARARYAGAGAGGAGAHVIAHFGTFGRLIAELLDAVLPAVLRPPPGGPRRVAVLIGRGGSAYLRQLVARSPELAGVTFATDGLPDQDVADHLAAADLMIQPFPDGVSCRRTTVMAGLALGVPVVTNAGALTEALWSTTAPAPVALAPSPEPGAFVAAADALLADPAARQRLGRAGRALYDDRFAVERTVSTLRALAAADDACSRGARPQGAFLAGSES